MVGGGPGGSGKCECCEWASYAKLKLACGELDMAYMLMSMLPPEYAGSDGPALIGSWYSRSPPAWCIPAGLT